MIGFTNKKVVIIGAQRSGQAAARLAFQLGAQVFISENAPKEKIHSEFKKWVADNRIVVEYGGHSRNIIEKSDLVVLSPGVFKDALPVKWAKAKNISVISEVELAYQACPCPIIAVTGSNGKTTVATLIKELMEQSGKNVCLCGNIGSAFSQYVLGLKEKDYVILEVSSFQLETIDQFKPRIAVFLNFSQNHLDRHKDLEEYFEAKKKIFSNQDQNDYAVLNASDDWVRGCAEALKAQVFYFNSPKDLETQKYRNPNFLAAYKVAEILGIDKNICQEVFDNFTGVEHRLEWVRSFNGVDFINDSKATTAEASRWALTNISQPVVWICGGREKNIDFSVLKDLVKEKVRKIIAIGEAKEKIADIFRPVGEVEKCGTLEEAVKNAYQFAQKGDCVLLSPMCASFDMFKDFEQRGKIYKELVFHLNKNQVHS